ncbi:MAG: heavy metal translocating P-type ATPase [Rhodocyclaceae bacterium]
MLDHAANCEVVHETATRLRVRMPGLALRASEPAWLESWLEVVPGVKDVRINPKSASVVVAFDPKRANRQAVLARLTAFQPAAAPDCGSSVGASGKMAPMVTSAVALALAPFLPAPQRQLLTLTNVSPLLARGAGTLLERGIKMEALDALAVGLATLKGELVTANLTALLLALGEFLEQQTQRKSDRLLRRLLQPAPAPAWVMREGELLQVSADEVQVGETVVVGIGETIPVDGRVVEGTALVNQAAVTGEDLPVCREVRQRVIAGSVVEEGRIRVEAQRVGADTTTARVASFIRSSLGTRSETQRLADELADQRVWLTLATGGLVYAATRDLTRLQAVFLVDYSCALKLGTPVAFKSGMVRAAQAGVLMRGGSAIEQLAAADTIVFDKTGTLTHSELLVTDVVALGARPLGEDALLALVASVEEHASHPLAQAIVDAAKERDLKHITHGEVDYLVAHGLSTEVDGQRVIIGSRHFLEEHHHIHFEDHGDVIGRLGEEGKTLLYVGAATGPDAGEPIGVVALRDTLRGDAAYTVRRLRALGFSRLVMISGDRRAKAQALATQLGLDEVHAEVAPEEKAAIIRQLQATGHKVAFVGDGINDGPALAVADVGLAMPRGADIARATADIVLLDDRLSAIAEAREIAAGTLALIRSNFRIAVGVNSAVLTGAVLGWLSPVMSAVLHNGTTLAVLLRALAGARATTLPEGRSARRSAIPAPAAH